VDLFISTDFGNLDLKAHGWRSTRAVKVSVMRVNMLPDMVMILKNSNLTHYTMLVGHNHSKTGSKSGKIQEI
jgi:hypothetical protein